jgi:hypothetical protein
MLVWLTLSMQIKFLVISKIKYACTLYSFSQWTFQTLLALAIADLIEIVKTI